MKFFPFGSPIRGGVATGFWALCLFASMLTIGCSSATSTTGKAPTGTDGQVEIESGAGGAASEVKVQTPGGKGPKMPAAGE